MRPCAIEQGNDLLHYSPRAPCAALAASFLCMGAAHKEVRQHQIADINSCICQSDAVAALYQLSQSLPLTQNFAVELLYSDAKAVGKFLLRHTIVIRSPKT